MGVFDARHLSAEAQQDLRRRLIHAVVDQSVKPSVAARLFEVARTSVSNWLQDLDVDGPARRQQRFQPLQDLAGQVELAPKVEPMLGGTMAIEPPHRLVSQIEPQVDRGRKVPDAQGTFEVAKGLVVAGLCGVDSL